MGAVPGWCVLRSRVTAFLYMDLTVTWRKAGAHVLYLNSSSHPDTDMHHSPSAMEIKP